MPRCHILIASLLASVAAGGIRSSVSTVRGASTRLAGIKARQQSPATRPRLAVASENTPTGDDLLARETRMSQAIPFLPRPENLDLVDMAGDYGFDPLKLAKDKETLVQYRLAEIKHGRLAMLAAAAWPLQELTNPFLAEKLGLPSFVAETGGRSPSVLNGGLEQVSYTYWTAVVLLTVVIETLGNDSWGGKIEPGDYRFDPLGFMPKDEAGKKAMKLKEIKHGRLAMMAILGFVVQEFVKKSAVVDQTPMFFKPFFE